MGNEKSVLTKTAKGLREATGRTSTLSRGSRKLLKSVDGQTSLAVVRRAFDKFSDEEFQAALDQLISGEYVQECLPAEQSPAHQAAAGPAGGESLDFTANVTSANPKEAENKGAGKSPKSRGAKPPRAAKTSGHALTDEELAKAEAELRAKILSKVRAAEENEAKRAAEKQQRENEKKARHETEERARREAEEQARREAEEQARREAEERTRREAEEQARREAEEQARRETEERARREAEEQARREAEEQARREVEERARCEAEEQARREAEEQAQREAEERAQREAEAAARRKVNDYDQRIADEAVERQAAEAARIIAEARAREEAEAIQAQGNTKSSLRRRLNWNKWLAAGCGLLLVVFLVYLHVAPFEDHRVRLEKLASEHFQRPVTIRDLRFSLLPQAHWRLAAVTIGGERQMQLGDVRVYAAPGVLFGDEGGFSAIAIGSMTLNTEALAWTLFGTSTGQRFKVDKVDIDALLLDSRHIKLPKMKVSSRLTAQGAWQHIRLQTAENGLLIELSPENQKAKFELSAKTLPLPLGSTLIFDEAQLSGYATPEGLTISEFRGRAHGGAWSGTARLNWINGWNLEGDMKGVRLDATILAPGVVEESYLDVQARYQFNNRDSEKLLTTGRVEGRFELGKGALVGVDFSDLLQGGSGSGGKTTFSETKGDFVSHQGGLQLRQIHLSAGAIVANGSAQVTADGALQGRLAVALSSPNMKRDAAFTLSGTSKLPRYNRQ